MLHALLVAVFVFTKLSVIFRTIQYFNCLPRSVGENITRICTKPHSYGTTLQNRTYGDAGVGVADHGVAGIVLRPFGGHLGRSPWLAH